MRIIEEYPIKYFANRHLEETNEYKEKKTRSLLTEKYKVE